MNNQLIWDIINNIIILILTLLVWALTGSYSKQKQEIDTKQGEVERLKSYIAYRRMGGKPLEDYEK